LAEQKAAALAAKNKKQTPQKNAPITRIIVENPRADASR
jgi:hypothetical protein